MTGPMTSPTTGPTAGLTTGPAAGPATSQDRRPHQAPVPPAGARITRRSAMP
jgi:hypothetical protein